jgi:hypothetical protein
MPTLSFEECAEKFWARASFCGMCREFCGVCREFCGVCREFCGVCREFLGIPPPKVTGLECASLLAGIFFKFREFTLILYEVS